MEYLTGLAVVIGLLPLNRFALQWGDQQPTNALGIVSVMMFMNAVIVLVYAGVMKPEGDATIFILGVFTALMINMMYKLKSLLGVK
tara:strand:+ start:8511 stop:8768 length:258 start_codon:yes stop_codon:yes gene_type:complete